MKRVETSEATTSRGPEGVGPAGLATPPEPGVTWSVVLGVSEGGGKEGRATSLGWEKEGGGKRAGWQDGCRELGRETGDSGSVGGGRRDVTQRCPKGTGEGERRSGNGNDSETKERKETKKEEKTK